VEHYENLGLPPVAPYLHQPKYSPIKVHYFLTLKEKCKGFQYLETSDVELKDTFVWVMSTITFYIDMGINIVIL
jgi:hypothetical protein